MLSLPQRQHARRQTVVAPIPPENVPIRYEVEFYPDDLALVKGFARLTEAILGVGNVAVVIANETHRGDILQRLRARGVKVDMAIEQQNYISFDATELPGTIMVHGMPDEIRLRKVIDTLLARVTKDTKGELPRVAICGECAPTLLQDGEVEAAIRLERLWDQTTSSYGVDTLCAYLWSGFPNNGSSPIFARICAEHSAVQGRALGY